MVRDEVMGDFSEHILFGLLTATGIAYLAGDLLSLTLAESAVSVMAVFIGSLIPDIDHKNSYIHRAVKAFLALALAGLAFLVPADVGVRFLMAVMAFLAVHATVSKMKIRHRGFTHSISFSLIAVSFFTIAAVLSMGSFIPGIAFGIGVLSHLLLDGEFKLE